MVTHAKSPDLTKTWAFLTKRQVFDLIRKNLVVNLEQGLHARPASVFVRAANAFQSEIRIGKGDKLTNAKSILGVLSLAIAKGQEMILEADGPDEDEAASSLEQIILSKEV